MLIVADLSKGGVLVNRICWWNAILLIIGYWVINLLSVYAFMPLFRLLAAIVPYGFRIGDLMIAVESYAASALAAELFLMKCTRGEHPMFCMANTIVSAVLFAIHTITFVFELGETNAFIGLVANGVSTAVYICFAVAFAQDVTRDRNEV